MGVDVPHTCRQNTSQKLQILDISFRNCKAQEPHVQVYYNNDPTSRNQYSVLVSLLIVVSKSLENVRKEAFSLAYRLTICQ